MATIPFLATIAAVLMVVTLASAYNPSVITTEVGNDHTRSRCRQQMRSQQQKLDHCEQYLSGRIEDEILSFRDCRNQACCLRECCRALRGMDEDCACETLKRIVGELQERGEEMETRETRTMLRKARELPSRCGMEERRCDIRAVYV
ncbi:hypothetical protein Ancab_025195 [Ancistrocladus abbreviatus]